MCLTVAAVPKGVEVGDLSMNRHSANLKLRYLMLESTKQQKQQLLAAIDQSGLDSFEVAQNFPVFSTRRNVARFLAHYELFKQIHSLPGSIVDLGIYRGASTFTWAKLCEIFCPTDVLKFVYAFDTFAGFPAVAAEDGGSNASLDRVTGGYNGGSQIEETLRQVQLATKLDKHIRDVDRVELIKGDVIETIPSFVKSKGEGLKVCLLNLDLDLYEGTLCALEYFYPRMVRGGIIVLDEYAHLTFGGETKAFDDFCKAHGLKLTVQKFPWHSNPSGFVVVD